MSHMCTSFRLATLCKYRVKKVFTVFAFHANVVRKRNLILSKCELIYIRIYLMFGICYRYKSVIRDLNARTTGKVKKNVI